MEIPSKIQYAAQRLKDGHRVNRITVRDFLRHFDAERRGAVKVQNIRDAVDELGLKTEPDFETAWIDEPIWLQLESGPSDNAFDSSPQTQTDGEVVLDGTPSAVEAAQERQDQAPVSDVPETTSSERVGDGRRTDDPTFRIGSLPAANKSLVVVNQDDALSKAITLMLEHDFSQLPVMQGEREVKGIVTWKSIASKMALGGHCQKVRDCSEEVRIVDSSRTLFGEIPTIIEFGYVLVRNSKDRKITGVVTASDLSAQFQILAEPFLLLREVELHLRRLLEKKVDTKEFEKLAPPLPGSKKPETVSDLNFGDYVRLVQHPDVWRKLDWKIDNETFCTLIDRVRVIRNDVMHFDPDPMTEDELNTLKRAVRFMQQLADIAESKT